MPIADEYHFVDRALRPCEPLAHAFHPSRHSTELIEKARRWWLAAMRSEYESASIFIDIATQLRQIGIFEGLGPSDTGRAAESRCRTQPLHSPARF
ncbi:MAG: hypothetical protein ABJA82_17440 [Myxococcales bacterium]